MSDGESRVSDSLEFTSVLPSHTFPDEIVEDILIRAWLDTRWSSPKSRWHFYRKILGLSHQWHRIVSSVAYQYRCLESLADFQVYSHLSLLSPGDKPCSRFKYLRMPYNDMSLSFLPAFGLRSYVGDCFELEISPMSNGKLWELCKILTEGDLRSEYLHTLSFTFEHFAVDGFPDKSIWPDLAACAPQMSSITTLSVLCTDANHVGWFYRDVLDFQAVLSAFPKLTHLRTNVPIALTQIATYLQALSTFTLVVPPLYMQDFHATSLLQWGVIGSLKRSVFLPKKIVVESGHLKPLGWEQLCKVCDDLGVQAVYVMKYCDTYQAPPLLGVTDWSMRNLETAAARFEKLPLGADVTAVKDCIDRHIDRYHTEASASNDLPFMRTGRRMHGIVIRY